MINFSANRGRIRFNRTVLAAAVSQFMMGITFTVANQMTTVGNAIILQYTSMIFVLLYQIMETGKLPSLKQIGVVAIVIVGMLVFFLDSSLPAGMIGNIICM